MSTSTGASAPANPALPAGFTKLAAAGVLFKNTAGWGRFLKRWGIRLLIAIVVLIVLWKLLGVGVGIATSHMWFSSVDAGSVYTKIIGARIGLFAVFAVIAALVCGFTVWGLRRIEPLPVSQEYDTFRWTFRRYEHKVGLLLVAIAAVVPGIWVGRNAASSWQTYLMWRHPVSFHRSDPTFHKDPSFYIDVLPFHQLVVSLLLQAVTYALWIAIVGGYWYGTWRIRRGTKKSTRGIVVLVSLLAAAFIALKAVNYWLSRYAVVTSSRGPVTGAGYTDKTTSVPAAYAMMGISIACAVGLVANAFLAGSGHRFFGRLRTLTGIVVLMMITSTLAGTVAPGLVFHYRESPSAAKLDLPEIAHNQAATKAAFGLDGDVTTIGYKGAPTSSATELTSLAGSVAQTSVIDPNQLSPTFNVEQQLQAYYKFKSTLDLANYDINGKSQDVALAVRELSSSGIPGSTWVNKHLVYTHGYGVVAAPTTEVDKTTSSPVYLDGGIPPTQEIPVTRPQVYFGQGFAAGSYAIAGQPAGSTRKLEFDHPGANGSTKAAHTTYTGGGGVPLGSTLRRLLFAVQLKDPNIFFSSELNSASQLLEIRNPRTRVAKVAPWLTLDGDVYPAVVDGEIKWIVDGYTTTSNYPDSQEINLHSASSTTLTANGASIAQPSTQLNYMQNSVKAVVDAYTGKVTLYEWNQKSQPDPLLKTWESVFPGLVKPQSDISASLLKQMRYPTDLFNVQRSLMAKYHVTSAANFYSGNDFWTVPTDPTVAATSSLNAAATTTTSPPMPARYMSSSSDGFGAQQYSLSSPMVNLNGHSLAAYVYVNSEPGPDYGKFTVLQFPSGQGGEAPSQVQNDIESNTTITESLTLERGGNSTVVLGSLQAIPVAGQMLYVEPVYTQSSGTSSFPILRHVIALYGNGDPSFQPTVGAAIKQAINSAVGTG